MVPCFAKIGWRWEFNPDLTQDLREEIQPKYHHTQRKPIYIHWTRSLAYVITIYANDFTKTQNRNNTKIKRVMIFTLPYLIIALHFFVFSVEKIQKKKKNSQKEKIWSPIIIKKKLWVKIISQIKIVILGEERSRQWFWFTLLWYERCFCLIYLWSYFLNFWFCNLLLSVVIIIDHVKRFVPWFVHRKLRRGGFSPVHVLDRRR